MVVGKLDQNKYYRIDGLYGGPSDDCWQSSDKTDAIYYSCDSIFFWVKDLLSVITPAHSAVEEFYEFDNSHYEYFFDNTGRLVNQSGAYISNDGKWAVIAIKNTGLMRVELATMKMRLFTKDIQLEGFGFNPIYSMSIDQSGNYIAIGGSNAGASIYDLSSSCGDESSTFISTWYDRQVPISTCHSKNLIEYIVDASGKPESGFKAFTNVYISPDAAYITGVYTPMNTIADTKSGATVISIRPHVSRLSYLALGDSYSSGEGDIPKDSVSHYKSETDYNGGCHLSTRSYPYRIAAKLQIDQAMMGSVACSGARLTVDVARSIEGYFGQGDRLLNKSPDELLRVRTSALDRFIPGFIPQMEFVKKYKPSYITITAGGNDIGFADILLYCAGELRTCDFALPHTSLNTALMSSIKVQKDRLQRFINQVKAYSPSTVIYILGYPQLVADNKWCQHSVGYLNQDEKRMIINAVGLMNRTIKSSAVTEGAYYVDIENSLDGGRLCEGTHNYMSGLDNIPNGVLNQGAERAQAFHPNALGHEQIAQAILRQYPLINTTVSNPTPQFLSAPLDAKDLPLVGRSAKLVYDAALNRLSVSTRAAEFLANSDVNITIFSHEHTLGRVKAEKDGSVNKVFTLPKHFEHGEHVVVIKGVDAQGNSKYVYEFITLGESNLRHRLEHNCVEQSANYRKFECEHQH